MLANNRNMDTQQSADIEEIASWFKRPRSSRLGKERVMELYFTFHPRTAFFKTLPANAAVADIGAGDGSLSVFRAWPAPERRDLKIFAYSIEKGRLFDDFDGYELSDWNAAPPEFDGATFDAVICAHFIEHIADPASFVEWAGRKLNPGGRLYLEWPSPASLELPTRAELEKAGVPLMISRFDDDHTHRKLPDGDLIAEGLLAHGFCLEARGIVRLPWLEDEMLAHYRDDADGFARQAAFWSRTGWSQYIVAQRA
jgi:SAM-dependent methyltransferase